MRWSIFENIIELYQLAGKIDGLKTGIDERSGWVLNKPGYWPGSFAGNPPDSDYPAIIQKSENGLLPPFLIFPADVAKKHLSLFRQHRFREIFKWEGMFLYKKNFIPHREMPVNYLIQQVSNKQELTDWLSVVKPVMLPDKSLSEKLLDGFISHPSVILLTGYFGNQPVSAGMAFTHNNVSGIYFIATLPEYRGKGYASALVSKLTADCFENGAKEVILHASDAGKFIYINLGFEPAGEMSTFLKIGK
jgi:ribosomal protein S18 acetylase RimI-like enzyme